MFVVLPAEDQGPGEEELCGELYMSMYGTRDAAQKWSEEYSATLLAAGFIRGIANPCLFRHATKDISLVVHGDDFMGVGTDADLSEVRKMLEQKYKIKSELLGGDASDLKEIRVLNRIIRYGPTGVKLKPIQDTRNS